MRRLGDRYVIEAALAVANGRPVPDDVQAAFAELPAVMERTESRADRVDTAVLDLAEAVMLSGLEGEVFDAVVVDEDHRGVMIQVVEPAVLARVHAHRVDPGDSGPGAPDCRRRPDPARRVHTRRLSPVPVGTLPVVNDPALGFGLGTDTDAGRTRVGRGSAGVVDDVRHAVGGDHQAGVRRGRPMGRGECPPSPNQRHRRPWGPGGHASR